jgi:hypothetical protein
VLAEITAKLAADEARHAASFYAYARRHLERASDPIADRRDALKVLFVWLHDNDQVRHPVNAMIGRSTEHGAALQQSMPRARILDLIGTLVDLPLDETTDLLAQVRDLGTLPLYRGDAR